MRFSRQDNLELHFGCHTCWLSYFTLVCLWCGQTVSRTGGRSVYGHVITNVSRKGRSLHFLTYGAPLASFARESSAINWSNNCLKELCETLLNRANSSTYSQKAPAVTWFGLFYFTREEPGTVQKGIELWDSFGENTAFIGYRKRLARLPSLVWVIGVLNSAPVISLAFYRNKNRSQNVLFCRTRGLCND